MGQEQSREQILARDHTHNRPDNAAPQLDGPNFRSIPPPLHELAQTIELRRNPSLPDYEHRHRHGQTMFAQIHFLETRIDLMKRLVRATLTPDNSPWTINAVDTYSLRTGRLEVMGWHIRLDAQVYGTSALLDPNNPATDIDRRLLAGRNMLATIRSIGELYQILEQTIRETMLPENSPFETAIPAHDAGRLAGFLQQYGEELRAFNVQYPHRLGPNPPRHVLHALHLGNAKQFVIEPDLEATLPTGPRNSRPAGHLLAFQPVMRTLRETMNNYDPQAAEAYILRHVPERPRPATAASVAAICTLVRWTFKEVKDHVWVADQYCPICLTSFDDGRMLAEMPHCGHIFHHQCIEEWLYTQSARCPTCRRPLVAP